MLTNGSKERSQRLLKMSLGGVHTFLLVTNKIILFIVRKRTRRTFIKSVSQRSALSMGCLRKFFFLKTCLEDFPPGPVAKTLCPQCKERGFDPWSGN